VKLRPIAWCYDVPDVIGVTDACEDKVEVVRSIRVAVDVQALVAPAKLSAPVSVKFAYDKPFTLIISNQADQRGFGIRLVLQEITGRETTVGIGERDNVAITLHRLRKWPTDIRNQLLGDLRHRIGVGANVSDVNLVVMNSETGGALARRVVFVLTSSN
jgi:hypothetical protein